MNIQIEVNPSLCAVADDWRALQSSGTSGPHQTYEWVKTWHETVGAARGERPVIVLGRSSDGRALFLLPFALARVGPARILKLLGGNHGNYGSGLYDDAFAAACGKETFLSLWSHIARLLPRHDVVYLRSIVHEDGARADPLQWLPSVCTAESGHAFSLEAEPEAVYRARFNAKARAEHRRCERRLGDDGGSVTLECAGEPARMRELFDRLCEQRALQARETGVPNPLADPAVRRFYAQLFDTNRRVGAPEPRIFALHCGDEIAATNFGICHLGRFYGLLMSTTTGPLRRYGPGTVLFRRMTQHLFEQGCTVLDCGAGRDPHKLKWCDQTRPRCDALMASSWMGAPIAAAMKAGLVAKRVIKNDDRLWPLAKRFNPGRWRL